MAWLPTVVAAVRQALVGRGKLQQADLPAAQHQRQVVVLRVAQRGDAELAGEVERVLDAHLLQGEDGRDIQ